MANITLLGASYTDVPAVDLPKTGGGTVRFYENGGGSSVQTATGTVSGSGTNTLQIPCDFAPDLIYVHGDMTGDASTYLQANIDSSSSDTEEYIFWNDYGITGYSGDDASMPHGEYASGNVIFYMVSTSSSARFPSAVTYTYKFIKWT